MAPRRRAQAALADALTAPLPPPPPAPADIQRMVWTLARLPLAQHVRTWAVAAGKLASQAGVTYSAIIGPKLLVQRQMRFQDAFLTIGLTMGGNLLQLLEARWEMDLEQQFQHTMVPWLAKRRAQDVPHDAATFDVLGTLTVERATQWVTAAGIIGRLASSLYGTMGHAHCVPKALLGLMVGIAVLRHGLGAWWVQCIQQRVTDWTLERRRATFALLHGAGLEQSDDIATHQRRLEQNRKQRMALKAKSIGVESIQEALLLAACYGMYWRLGWFAPDATLATLVAVQTGMAATQALVGSILTVPLFAIEQMQMHKRVETYLRAEAG